MTGFLIVYLGITPMTSPTATMSVTSTEFGVAVLGPVAKP